MGSPAVGGEMASLVGLGGVSAVHVSTGTTAHPSTIGSGETVLHSLASGLPEIHVNCHADKLSGPVSGRNHRPNRVTMAVVESAVGVSTTKHRPFDALVVTRSGSPSTTSPASNHPLIWLHGESEPTPVGTKASMASAPSPVGIPSTSGSGLELLLGPINRITGDVFPAGGPMVTSGTPTAVGPLP